MQRQAKVGVALCILIICLGFCTEIISSKAEGMYYPKYAAVSIGLFGIAVFGYYITYNVKRNIFKKKGERFQGYIVGADEFVRGRGDWTYYLKISFYDDGEKIKYTEGYAGNPNKKLKNRECNIYKWRGKYIESDFTTLEKKEKPANLKIPISKYGRGSKMKMYV